MNATVRSGSPADLPQIIEIANASRTAAHWRAVDYEQIFQSKRVLLVAESNSEVIGFLVAHDTVGEWELENIVVAPVHRGWGFAKQMLQRLIHEAANRNGKFIFLEVRESNAAAKRLYERCGFQQYGRRPGYYSGPVEDAILYRFLCIPKSLENC
ncbi:MAG TPA: ribosomal protein S18-alanine N-acetyltransferase [Terriglobales bacterium]|nr:ribosomal protein S18-alanine N-acetyltransferase [Terriglobales bacterium]